MPDRPETSGADQPEAVDEDRRRLLAAGLKLAGAAGAVVALDAMAPAIGMARAAANFRDRGSVTTANPGTPGTQSLTANALETPTAVSSPTPAPTPQSTSTPDPEASLRQRVLRDQANQLESPWYVTNAPALIGSGLTAATIGASVWGVVRSQRTAREQNQEQQRDQLFQHALAGLGNEKSEAGAAAATMLLVFYTSQAMRGIIHSFLT